MAVKVVHYSQVPAEPVAEAEGVTIRWLIARTDGAHCGFLNCRPAAVLPITAMPGSTRSLSWTAKACCAPGTEKCPSARGRPSLCRAANSTSSTTTARTCCASSA